MYKINPEIVNYVEKNILPQYKSVDKAHGIDHIRETIRYSMKIADELYIKLNYNMIYVIAAYHDIGLTMGDRDNHHINSRKFLCSDNTLRKWFDEEEIKEMAMACQQHRSSSKEKLDSIYSVIISDADSLGGYNIRSLIKRTIIYSISNMQDFECGTLYKAVRDHLIDKYGSNGYHKFHIALTRNIIKENERNIKDALQDETKFKQIYYDILSEM